MADNNQHKNLKDVAALFLLMGLTAFGGPAAHVGLFHDQVVRRRKWLSDQEFLDLVGSTQIIPGPNSSELVFYISYLRAGWPGLVVGGLGWILPSLVMIIALAWGYTYYGSTPQIELVFRAVKPIVIAIIAKALYFLGKNAIKDFGTALIAAAVTVFSLLGAENIWLLIGGGLFLLMARKTYSGIAPKWGFTMPLAGIRLIGVEGRAFSLMMLFLQFLKIGSLLYGSGYVLFAFLNETFVQEMGWLSIQQIIDGVAVGQLTPGPLSSSASFLGFLLGGVPGALLAELGIYLPSFLLVVATRPITPKLRESEWVGFFLDGVNAASLGLMGVVTWRLAQSALVDLPTVGLGLISGGLVFFTNVNTTAIIIGGVIIGLARYALGL